MSNKIIDNNNADITVRYQLNKIAYFEYVINFGPTYHMVFMQFGFIHHFQLYPYQSVLSLISYAYIS